MTYKVYMCQEKKKKKEDNLPALKIAMLHQYKDSRNTLKRAKKMLLKLNVLLKAQNNATKNNYRKSKTDNTLNMKRLIIL